MGDSKKPATPAPPARPTEADGDPAARLELMSMLEAHAAAESRAGKWLHLDREALSVRLTLARNALIATGYFTADQVGDDVAPRITEMFAALAAPTGQEAQE